MAAPKDYGSSMNWFISLIAVTQFQILCVKAGSFSNGRLQSLFAISSSSTSTTTTSSSSSSGFPWDYPTLSTHLQSPVDLLTSKAISRNFRPLEFTAVNNKDVVCVIMNSGHGVTIKIDSSDDSLKPQLHGSFLTDNYVFENLHFHWGKEDYFGSEHFINGESFSLEGHMVMFKKEYDNINNALRFKDGVIVLTFFATVGRNNKYLDRLLQYIPQIADGKNSEVRSRSADVVLWFLPDIIKANQRNDYLTYFGSLTTSPFTESVTFIIIPEPIEVSHGQLEVLRTLKDHKSEPVFTNRRELQPLRGRPLLSGTNIQWNILAKKKETIEPSALSKLIFPNSLHKIPQPTGYNRREFSKSNFENFSKIGDFWNTDINNGNNAFPEFTFT